MTDKASKFLADENFQKQFCDALEHQITVLQRAGLKIVAENINTRTRTSVFDKTVDLKTVRKTIQLILKPTERTRQAIIQEHNLFQNLGVEIIIENAQFVDFKYLSSTKCTIKSFCNTLQNSIPQFLILNGELNIDQNISHPAEQDIYSALIRGKNNCRIGIKGQLPKIEIADSQSSLSLHCASDYILINNSRLEQISLHLTKASVIDFQHCETEMVDIHEIESQTINFYKCSISENIDIRSSKISEINFKYSRFENFLFKSNSNSYISKLKFSHCENRSNDQFFSNLVHLSDAIVCVGFSHVNSTMLKVSENCMLYSFECQNCKISDFQFCNSAFTECRDLQIFSNNEIPLINLPHAIDAWPKFGNIADQYCENWMLSFNALAKNAEQEEFFDRKMLFVRMSQQFRSKCSPFPRAKFLLKLYGMTCSFGTKPFYALLWWIFISLFFLVIYWFIVSLPLLKLSYMYYLDTIASGQYFSNYIIPSFFIGYFSIFISSS